MNARLDDALGASHLMVMGGFHPEPEENLGKTLLLLGPAPGFWPHFLASSEARDGVPDPMDRWSERIVSQIADKLDARAVFPFGGPPHLPFFSWATRTGRIWSSPVAFLVHTEQGLWSSFRGALIFDQILTLPPLAPRPCDSCADKPCLTACPIGALTSDGYDVPACKTYLADDPPCMQQGCAVRAACPVSQSFAREPAQSAFHMRSFL